MLKVVRLVDLNLYYGVIILVNKYYLINFVKVLKFYLVISLKEDKND